jgi:hypothetical protein
VIGRGEGRGTDAGSAERGPLVRSRRTRVPPVRRAGARRTRLIAAGAALVPVLAACGIQPSGIVSLGAAPAAVQASVQDGAPATIGSDQYVLFFYQGTRLLPVYRETSGPIDESLVLKELLNGPNSDEKQQGYTSALPANLAAKPNAEQERYAFAVSTELTARGRSEFICTMQYIDESNSIGIETIGLPGSMLWLGCSDTTLAYVPEPQQGAVASTYSSGQ